VHVRACGISKFSPGVIPPGPPQKKGRGKREGKTGESVGQGAEGEGIGVQARQISLVAYTTD